MSNSTATTPALQSTASRIIAPLSSHPDGRPMARDYDFYQGTAETLEMYGSAGSLAARGIAVNAGFITPVSADSPALVTGADGEQWQVWGADLMSLRTRRPRTEQERIRFIDHGNTRVKSNCMSLDRLAMTKAITLELLKTAFYLNSEAPMARAARRELKTKMLAFSRVQLTLLAPDADMPALRKQLAEVGLVVPVVDYLN